MEDSPLSITANVTGILTFAVAILASIYVRIVSLRNGILELMTIRESSEDSVLDLIRMNIQERSNLQKNHIMQRTDGLDVTRLKILSARFITTDMVIYMYCNHAVDYYLNPEAVEGLQDVLSSLHGSTGGIIDHIFDQASIEISNITMRRSFLERIFDPHGGLLPAREAAFLMNLGDGLQRVLTLGLSPSLLRWYRMRETVLERVRQRDNLRSRILSLQVSISNSSIASNGEALQRLVEQQAEVKTKLEELTRLMTTASQALARPASDDISGIPVETCTTVSPGQQEDIERHVDAGSSAT